MGKKEKKFMKYKVNLEATVEAESAEAAKNLFIDFSDNKEGVISSSIDAIPSNQWSVTVSVPVMYKFDLVVHAETEDEAEQIAINEVESINEIEEFVNGDGVSDYQYDVDTSAVEVVNVEDLDEDEDEGEDADSDAAGTVTAL
jgi:hypothetical protein